MPSGFEFERFDPLACPDTLLSLLVGGMQRAQQRYTDKLNTIVVDAPQIDTEKTTGVDVAPPYGRLEI